MMSDIFEHISVGDVQKAVDRLTDYFETSANSGEIYITDIVSLVLDTVREKAREREILESLWPGK